MKKTIIAAAFATLGTIAFGQDLEQSQVPSVIVNNFQQAFPKATKVEWEMSHGLYQAEFRGANGKEREVYYDSAGKLVRQKEESTSNELPANVVAAIRNEYPGFTIEEAERITEGNTVTYRIEVEKGKEEWILVTDDQGKVLSKKAD